MPNPTIHQSKNHNKKEQRNKKMREMEGNDDKPSMDLTNLKATRVLGRGSLGTVLLVTTSDDPHNPFALKVVPNSNPTVHRRIHQETSILSLLSHPFLPTLITPRILSTPFLSAYAMPFCSGGDLNILRHSQPDGVFSLPSLRFYAAEILSALHYLHTEINVVYRDLKPENILIQSSGHVMLSDFDLSRPDKSERSFSFVGTDEYISPEVILGQGNDFAVDFWGLGVLLYEMAYGRTPFRGRNRRETFRNVVEKEVVVFVGDGDGLTDLVKGLLVKDPERRLGTVGGAEEVMRQRFFRGVQWEMLAYVDRPPFIPEVWEEEKGGFDVGEYFEKEERMKMRMKEEENDESTATSATSDSFTEF